MAHPRNESPDSINPVFWISIMGFLPPTDNPAAVENAAPSLLTGINSMVGSAFINRYNQFVSLSGNQTTCVTPLALI